jgi:hypothetical protein
MDVMVFVPLIFSVLINQYSLHTMTLLNVDDMTEW